jgi:hypothetical protein
MGLALCRRDGRERRDGPSLGAVARLHEKFVERKLDRRADNVKGITGGDGVTDAFSVVHRVRDGGSRIKEGRGAKVGGEDGREAKEGVLRTEEGGGCGSGGVGGVSAIVVIGVGVRVVVRIGKGRRSRIGECVFLGGTRPRDGTATARDIVLELGRGLEVGLLYGGSRSGGCGLIDREGELHALDRAGTTIDVGLARTFFLCRTLSDDVGRVITLETGCF